MKLEFCRQSFEKYSNIHFHENLSSESRVFVYDRTDGHDVTNSRFSQNYTDVCVVGMAFRTRQIFNISVKVRNNKYTIIVRCYYYSAGPGICF